ncbi:M56 family metallopeptidase [Flaviaesturariibacter flavus]|uniref:M56 family metallopeptidase n=1 Tax=Flaviaesturariibacter flavus TaxID=2502780 RepID=A0A4V2NWX0_9BACT|nr:M56 family metallopeptidase [Flaviaesturariibacter flavus]TCJ19002.1 M56 family metallopeptidase [Flaviaesturariibacter flavus]
MALSQSIFLQALGWATLNSFWQLGLLWCLFQLTGYFARPSSNQRYLQAVYSLALGAAWFAWTFYTYLKNGISAPGFLAEPIVQGKSVLPMILTGASVTYILLLVVPVFNVLRNWRYVQAIRTRGLSKAPVKYRLFVDKIAGHVGIRKRVRVYLSSLVTSPLTIGYLKPVILLPVAAMANLTPAQLEAVLLHELSHIRRYDYLVNLLITAINVVLYFNPFVRLFIRAVENERENCCDELVLQFEYDKVGYASALLELEKSNHVSAELAMGATGRNALLSRIEKIVGIRKKPRINAQHLMGAFAAMILVLTLNSMVIRVKAPVSNAGSEIYGSAFLPYNFPATSAQADSSPVATSVAVVAPVTAAAAAMESTANPKDIIPTPAPAPEEPVSDFRQVAFDETYSNLSPEDVEKVKATVENTRKTLEAQWNTVEKNFPDGLTDEERVAARHDYMSQVERINWQRVEQNLKAGYEKIDLDKANKQMACDIASARMDSIQTVYQQTLVELDKLTVAAQKGRISATPLPDASISELKKARRVLSQKIAEISELKGRGRKDGVIKL